MCDLLVGFERSGFCRDLGSAISGWTTPFGDLRVVADRLGGEDPFWRRLLRQPNRSRLRDARSGDDGRKCCLGGNSGSVYAVWPYFDAVVGDADGVCTAHGAHGKFPRRSVASASEDIAGDVCAYAGRDRLPDGGTAEAGGGDAR